MAILRRVKRKRKREGEEGGKEGWYKEGEEEEKVKREPAWERWS